MIAIGALSVFVGAARSQEFRENSPVTGIGTPQVGHVFSVPPNPGAPFMATVEFETTQILSDRTVMTHRSTSHVARDGKGRTRNELQLTSDGPTDRTPGAFMVILYDPQTRVRTTLFARTHTATQAILNSPETSTKGVATGAAGKKSNRSAVDPNISTEEIGMDYMDGMQVKHFRERNIASSVAEGDDSGVETLNEYWYSPELKVNLMSKRIDPRSGTQSARLKGIQRGEPDASLFAIPAGYKLLSPGKPVNESR
jgi:hypothetical protein